MFKITLTLISDIFISSISHISTPVFGNSYTKTPCMANTTSRHLTEERCEQAIHICGDRDSALAYIVVKSPFESVMVSVLAVAGGSVAAQSANPYASGRRPVRPMVWPTSH